MLSEKYKQIIEDVALNLQMILGIKDVKLYNVTDSDDFWDNLNEFLKDAGCKVNFNANDSSNSGSFSYKEKAIDLSFSKEELIYPSETDNLKYEGVTKNWKILFHEIWHFLSTVFDLKVDKVKKTTPVYYSEQFSTEPFEISAVYFSRAMIMPKNLFIEKVAVHTDASGLCNVFNLAKDFNVSYIDVIARGKDLNLWNMKVGI